MEQSTYYTTAGSADCQTFGHNGPLNDASEEAWMALDDELLQILVCPKCKGELKYYQEDQKLVCASCRLAYRIEDDIPVMLIDEAEPIE